MGVSGERDILGWHPRCPKPLDDVALDTLIGGILQVGAIAMLEPAVRQAFSLHASVSGIDKSGRDIDAEDVGAQPGLWQSRRPVTATQVQHLHSRFDSQSGDDFFSALAHAR